MAFSDMEFFLFSMFYSHFLLFLSSVHKCSLVLPSRYENKVRSWSSLFTDLCSEWLCEGFVVNVLVFKC